MPPTKDRVLNVIYWDDFYEGSKGSRYQEALHPNMLISRHDGYDPAMNVRKVLTPEKVKKHGVEKCFVQFDRRYVVGKIRWILSPILDLGEDFIIGLVQEAMMGDGDD